MLSTQAFHICHLCLSVPKHGWSSSRNTPEPYTAAKLLHKRDYRLPTKSPAPEAIIIDSPGRETPSMDPPRSSTPCPRSFTPSPQPKMPKKPELAVKVAQLLTESGYQTRSTNLSRETYAIMNKALHASQRSAQTRNETRSNTQRVWKYVTNSSSNKRRGVTPLEGRVVLFKDMITSKISFLKFVFLPSGSISQPLKLTS